MIGVTSLARAGTFVWDGGHPAQDMWSVNQNWNPNGAPTNDGTADLLFTGSIRLAPTANAGWSINSMAFDNAAGAFVIGGDSVSVQGTAVTVALANNSPNVQTMGNAFAVGANQTWNAATGDFAFTGTVDLGASALTLTGSANTSVSGVISGTGSLVKTGAGTLTLTGANSYTGGTTVSAGTLVGTTTSLQGNIVNTATVAFNQAANGTYAGVISGTGSLVTQASGTVTLAGANTFTGSTTVSSGTLALGGANALADTTAVSVASGATLQLAFGAETIGSFAGAGSIALGAHALTAGGTDASTTFSGGISGGGGIVKTGTGTLTLTGANSYTGGTTVSAGVLQGTTTSLQGNILNHAAVVFDQSANGTFLGVMSGTGSLTKENSGTLTLSGANTFTGATAVNAGTLALGAANALSDSTAVSIAAGATLQLAGGSETIGSFAGAGSIVLGGFGLTAGGTNASTAFSGGIAGTGSLTKTGAGTLTLSGANTYSGGTTVIAGTLQGTTTSLQGNIVNQAGVIFDQATSGTYAGAISGTGSVMKQNSGTLTLSGANSYSGGTTVGAGTLQGTTTSLQGNIVNQAAVVFDQATSGTYVGVMSGTGSLTKQNTGTVTLSGANTYSGGTTVSAGTLQGTTSSLQGNIVNQATVVFDQATNGTYAGVMSGTGSLTKQNTGIVTLSGANTYSGGTTVSAGTLQGTTTSLQGNIVNQAAVIFDQATSGTYVGVMAGTGSLTKQSSGTLTLSGANTYSGGTTVSAGTLQGTTTSLQGNIVNQAAVVFNQSSDGNFGGTISGAGAVTKAGSGVVTLSGANTYSGTTTVAGGTLALGATNAFSAGSNLTLGATTTVALGGFSTEVGRLSYNTSMIDFGIAGAANHFLFNGGGTSAGTLTITNYSTGDGDIFAFRTGSTGVDAAFVNGVYFYGTGSGVLGASGQAIGGYSGTWDFIVPDATPFKTWDGGGNNNFMGTATNWVGDVAPAGSTTLKLAFAGSTRTSPVLNGGSFDLNTLRFDATAGAFTLSASGGSTLIFGGSIPGIIQLSASAQSVNVPLTLNTTTMVETSGAGTLTLAGIVAGTGGLTKVGANTLVLSGANTYSGTTTVGAGTLVLQNSGALGSTSAGTAVSGGATLQLENNISVGAEALLLEGTLRNASGTNAYAGAISGNGRVTVDGGGLTLAGTAANSYTGGTTVNAGTLDLNKTAGVNALTGNIIVGNGSGSATLRLLASNQISDTAAITLAAGGTPVFNVNGQAETIGSIASSNATAALQLGSGGALTSGGDNTSTTFAGVVSGAGALTKAGTGTFTLSGANTYTGTTTVSAGTLVLQNSAALGTTAGGTAVSSGATLQLENNVAVGAEALALAGTLRSASGTNSYGGLISGTGAVTVDGGTLTLAGAEANTFTGATTVNAGTLDLAKTAGQNAVSGNLVIGNGVGPATVRLVTGNQISDTAAVTLAAGGAPVFNLNGQAETIGSLASSNAAAAVQLGGVGGSLSTGGNNASTTFAGVISGAGSLTKQGSGTLTLGGTNTYSGGTTVNAGILQGTTTSLQGNIVNYASTVFDQAGPGTYGGVMSGPGSLTKQNAGTLTLAGANTYSGGTTVSAGILQGSTTSLQGNIANQAAVVFDQASAGTYAGVMSGAGSLTKQNAGTLTLAGANTYSGGTMVSAGTLQGTATSLQGNITNHAAVVFDQPSAGTYAGVMSGTGSLTKENAGTLTLSGANTYSGGTTVSAGTLQGSTTSLQGNITNHAAVVFDQASAGTYAGVMSGAGSLTKQNAGTLTLAGANTFTGGTTVSGGTLALGASDVLADSGNITLGYGSTLNLGGTFSERVGTLNFESATVNLGTTGSANHFLISGFGTGTGTLTIANWTSGSDTFGVASGAVSQSILDSVFFSNINVGIGAVLSASPVSVGTYGNFYTLTPIPTFTWDGGHSGGPAADVDNWSKGNNWSGDIAPAVGAAKAIVMAGVVRTANDLDGAYQINSLLFRADAGAFTITSSTADTLTIGGGGMNNQSTSTQTLSTAIALSADQTWTAASGNLVVNGATLLNGTRTLTVTGGHDTTISAVIGAGSGGIVKNGTGVLTLSGANTFTGGVTLNAGVLAVSSGGNLGDTAGSLTFNGGALRTSAGISAAHPVMLGLGGGMVDTNGFDSTLSGVVSGSGAFTKSGAGTLALSGANTYSGTTTITTGALRVQHNNALGSTAGSTTVAGTGAALELDRSVNGNLTVAAEPLYLHGTGVAGNGALRNVAGSNTFAGVVTLASASSISNSAAGTTLTLSGGTNSLSQALTVTGTGHTTISANMTNGTGTLTKEGTGTLTFSGFTGIVGQTNLSVGTMVVGTGGTTNLNTAEFSSATSTTLLVASGGTVNAVYGNGNTYFNGIFDAASAGTFAVTSLAGTSSGLTFGASFTATNLTLNLGGSSIGGSDLSNYFRLELAGVSIAVGTLHLTGDTILDFNGANATFLSSTNLIIDANVKIIVEGWMSAANDLAHSTVWYANGTINGGTLVGGDQIGGIPLNQITFTGYSPAMATGWIDGNHGGWFDREVRPTPEPTTYGAILIGAALGLLGYRRFIRRQIAPTS